MISGLIVIFRLMLLFWCTVISVFCFVPSRPFPCSQNVHFKSFPQNFPDVFPMFSFALLLVFPIASSWSFMVNLTSCCFEFRSSEFGCVIYCSPEGSRIFSLSSSPLLPHSGQRCFLVVVHFAFHTLLIHLRTATIGISTSTCGSRLIV